MRPDRTIEKLTGVAMAHHEAAHLVVAWELGVGVTSLRFYPADNTVCDVEEPDKRPDWAELAPCEHRVQPITRWSQSARGEHSD